MDLIERQAAIDAIRASTSKYTGFMEMEMYTDDDAVEAIEQLPSAQPKQRWIPCSERLPDKYGMYLVTMTEKAKAEDFGFDVDEIEVNKMRYNSNGWNLPRHVPAWINNVITDEVLAWMPLPEPYREEGDQDED